MSIQIAVDVLTLGEDLLALGLPGFALYRDLRAGNWAKLEGDLAAFGPGGAKALADLQKLRSDLVALAAAQAAATASTATNPPAADAAPAPAPG